MSIKKSFVIIICLFFVACSNSKVYNILQAKGYNIQRDTIDIKPYEYAIIQKGYDPIYKQCLTGNNLDIKISIKGYEMEDSIPISALPTNIQFIIYDTEVKQIVKGVLTVRSNGWQKSYKIIANNIDNYKLLVRRRFNRRHEFQPNDVIFLTCFTVRKGNTTYTLPSRKYVIK